MFVNNSSMLINTLIFMMNQSSIEQDDSYNYYYLQIGKTTNASKCYGIYGCFQLSPPWTSEHRPVSLFPEDLDEIEPRFFLYTRKNGKKPVFMDLNEYDVIASSGIDPHLPVYVVTHGFMEEGFIFWILETVTELLKKKDCSVIVVDWQGGSRKSYTQAVANVRLVSVMTAYLLRDLSEYTRDKKLDQVHCIGHSLGAHLCGYVGYTLQSFNLTLDRITGMDPAEPHFAKANRPVRLDRSAAKYVDIIHTDATQFIRGGLGITENIGHVDYYPNGGSDQPGCKKSIGKFISDEKGSLLRGLSKYLGCNHMKSHEYFVDTINPTCSFKTVACSSYEDFLAGNCFDCGSRNEKCITFGYNGRKDYERLIKQGIITPNAKISQYLFTGADRPYCRAHYKITVTISDSEESRLHGGEIGQLVFTMHSTIDGKGPKSSPASLNKGGYHEPGKTYTAVVPSSEIPKLKAVEVEWRHASSFYNPLTWRILSVPKIYIQEVIVESLELETSITVCPKEVIPLENSQPLFMLPSYC